jgi:cell division initiation protein
LSRSQTFTFGNLENLGYEEEVEEEIEESPLAEMEVIEENLELEDHDATPDLEMEIEEDAEEELELEDTKMELEDEVLEEDIEEMEEAKEKKPFEEPLRPQPTPPKLTDDAKNQPGSFFDQFD